MYLAKLPILCTKKVSRRPCLTILIKTPSPIIHNRVFIGTSCPSKPTVNAFSIVFNDSRDFTSRSDGNSSPSIVFQ